ncbi:MAG: immunoglobulin-like domain-containing protein [Oscillospiraceae bacterium]
MKIHKLTSLLSAAIMLAACGKTAVPEEELILETTAEETVSVTAATKKTVKKTETDKPETASDENDTKVNTASDGEYRADPFDYDELRALTADDVATVDGYYCDEDENLSSFVYLDDKDIISQLLDAFRQLDVQREIGETEFTWFNADVEKVNTLTFRLNNNDPISITFMVAEDGTKCIAADKYEVIGNDYTYFRSENFCDYTALADKTAELFRPIAEENCSVYKEYGVENNALAASYCDDNSGSKYTAGCPAVVCARFVALDTDRDYETGFDCRLEKESGGIWKKVEPIGNIKQANSGIGHFYNINEEGRKFVTFDLACYPLLDAGKYRIAKPFGIEGENDPDRYTVYYEFEMVERKAADIGGDVYCGKKEYPVNAQSIDITLDYDSGLFATSDVYDIERKEGGKWVSVRTGDVHTNSIGGSYALSFETEKTISGGDFDLSKTGDYRVRVSVGGFDADSLFTEDYGTKYAYFTVTDSADIGDITVELQNNDICEIDEGVPVTVTNKGSMTAALKSAEMTVGGKKVECEVRSYSNIYPDRDVDIIVRINDKMPTGNGELKLTFSAEGCKDKTVTVKFTVRKATEEEKNSGVFVETDKKSYAKGVQEIKVTVTNKERYKQDIIVYPIFCTISNADDEETLMACFDAAEYTIKYGESKTLTFKNYGGNIKEYFKAAYSILGYDITDEELNELDDQMEEIPPEDMEIYSMKKAGKYTVSVPYMTESGDDDEITAEFEVK